MLPCGCRYSMLFPYNVLIHVTNISDSAPLWDYILTGTQCNSFMLFIVVYKYSDPPLTFFGILKAKWEIYTVISIKIQVLDFAGFCRLSCAIMRFPKKLQEILTMVPKGFLPYRNLQYINISYIGIYQADYRILVDITRYYWMVLCELTEGNPPKQGVDKALLLKINVKCKWDTKWMHTFLA